MPMEDHRCSDALKAAVAERAEAMKMAVCYRLLLLDVCRPNSIPDFERAVAQARHVIETELKADGETWDTQGHATADTVNFLIGDLCTTPSKSPP